MNGLTVDFTGDNVVSETGVPEVELDLFKAYGLRVFHTVQNGVVTSLSEYTLNIIQAEMTTDTWAVLFDAETHFHTILLHRGTLYAVVTNTSLYKAGARFFNLEV